MAIVGQQAHHGGEPQSCEVIGCRVGQPPLDRGRWRARSANSVDMSRVGKRPSGTAAPHEEVLLELACASLGSDPCVRRAVAQGVGRLLQVVPDGHLGHDALDKDGAGPGIKRLKKPTNPRQGCACIGNLDVEARVCKRRVCLFGNPRVRDRPVGRVVVNTQRVCADLKRRVSEHQLGFTEVQPIEARSPSRPCYTLLGFA